MPIELSVVVVNYNAGPFLLRCLKSVMADFRGMVAEIVVVDNASGDGSADAAEAEFPEIRVLRNRENVGFARAVNQGLSVSRGHYLLILNPDTEIKSGAIRHLHDFLVRHRKAGLVGPRLLNPDGSVQHSISLHYPSASTVFHRYVAPVRLVDNLVRRGEEARDLVAPRDAHDHARAVAAISGACMMVRRQAYAEVGPMDEAFFLYVEDTDWCYRFRQAGWAVFFTHEAEVVHYRSVSARYLGHREMAEFVRGLLRFCRKHRGTRYTFLLRTGLAPLLFLQLPLLALAALLARPFGAMRQSAVRRLVQNWQALAVCVAG